MPEENQLAGNLLQTQEEADRKAQLKGQEPQNTRPGYNPLLGISRREFVQIMAGNDPDRPLVTTDAYGTPKFHLENFGQTEPTKVKVGPYGQAQVEGVRESMDRNMAQLSKDLQNFHAAFAPEIARDDSRSSYFNEMLQAVPEFYSQAGKSAGSMVMHAAHGVLAQKRNFDELNWNIVKENSKDDPAFIEAGAIVKQLEDSGQSIQGINVNSLDISDKTKDYLRQYQQLDESRLKDERRMRIAMAYDQDKTWVQNAMERTTWINPLGGDENSVIHTIANLSGDVAGSVAVFYIGGQAVGAAGRALGAVGRVGRAAKAAEAATLAVNGGADAAMIAAANIGEKFVFWPSFWNQYDQIRTESLIAGKSIGEANAIGFTAGMVEGLSEFAGFRWFKRFYTDGGIIRNYVLRQIAPEATQEGFQTLGENIITQTFGVTDKQWTDIMSEIGLSIVAGALGGGMFSLHRSAAIGAGAWAEGVQETLTERWRGLSQEQINRATDAVNTAVDAIEAKADIEEKLDVKKALNEQPKEQGVEDYLKAYRNLSADEKTAADAYIEAYEKLRDHYTDRMKEKNPNLSIQQRKNGWKAVRLQLLAQRDSNALVQTFDNAINQAAAFLQPDNEVVKHNTEVLNKRMEGVGFTPEQIKALSSPDALERHAAQWEAAENWLIERMKGLGVSEAEAKLMANFVRSMAYDATLINPNVSPESIVHKMGENMANVQVATLHNQPLPELFSSILNDINTRKFSKYGNKKLFQIASKMADALTAEEVDPALAAQISKDLYGNSEEDPDLSRTKAAVEQQAELVDIVLDHMPIALNQELGKIDYKTMVLMNRMGLGWKDIITDIYKITPNTKEDLDDVFYKTADKYLPKLSTEQLDKLAILADGANDVTGQASESQIVNAIATDPTTMEPNESQKPAYNEEMAEQMQKGTGFYEADEQMAVLVNPKVGTALHEFGHFSLTYMVTSATELERAGLLSNNSPIHRAFEYLRANAKETGFHLTEEQAQETILDAVNDVITAGISSDPILTGLINEMRALGAERYVRLSNSLYSRQGGKGGLNEQQKSVVKSQAERALSGITPGNILSDAYALREESRLENLPMEFNKIEDTPIKAWANRIREFAKRIPIQADVELVALDVAEATGDAIKIAQAANSISTKAIDYATNAFITQNMLGSNSDDLFPSGTSGIFFEKDMAMKERAYEAHFRDERGIDQKLKEVQWSDSFKMMADGIKNLFQSAEGAAGEIDEALGKGKGNKRGELRTLLMKSFYDYGMRMQKFRETAKDLVDAVDKHMNNFKGKPNAYQEEAKEWHRRFHMVLRNGKAGAYKQAGDFIEEKLGLKARHSWDETVELINDAKQLMISRGVNADLLAWTGDFFPFSVKDYGAFVKDFLGHSHAFAENEKERERFIKEYRKKHPEENEENIKRLYIALVDNQNSLMQRNADTEAKVTSFYRRTIDFVSDPAIMEFYRDPFDCLDRYMEAAYRTVMMRELIGKTVYTEDGNPIIFSEGQTGRIGEYLLRIPQGAVPTDVLNNFLSKMRALAQRDSTPNNTIWDIARQVNQITTLGNVFSSMNQVLDLEFCVTMFGVKATHQALQQVMMDAGKSITLEDVGAITANEVFRLQDESALKDIGKKVFKWSGFEWTDKKIKEVALNAAANWAKNSLSPIVNAKDTNAKLTKSQAQDYAEVKYVIDECFPEFDMRMLPDGMTEPQAKAIADERNARRNKLIKTLANGGLDKNGQWDADAKYIYWYMLTKLQPINAATVPANYNRLGAVGKMMYQFTTVATRQIGFLGDYWRMKERTGGKVVAAAGMLRFLGFCAAIGIPNDAIQDILKGRSPDIGKSMVMSPLHVMMVNEYTIATLKREGLWSAAITQFTPKFGVLNNVSKDAIRFFEGKDFSFNTAKNIPILGIFMYQFMFGGLEQKKKMGTDILGRKQDPVKARKAREATRRKTENIGFMEAF